jgi:hypothetical protein
MQLIPFVMDKDHYHLFVVLEDANIKRMKQYDPGQVDLRKLPEEWHSRKLDMVVIGYATPQDLAQVHALIKAGAGSAALEFLSRGFAYKQAEGDNDDAYTPS